jgi:hypothetical protein
MIDDEAFPGQIDYQRNVISEFSPSDLISLGILQNMDGLFTKKERTATVRLFGNVIGLRLGSIALGALMSLTSVTGSLAARVAALEL